MKRTIIVCSLMIVFHTIVWASVNSPERINTIFIVNNLNDAGAGSLRQAITDANALTGNDIINFSPTLSGVIYINSKLPTITEGLSINGPGAGIISINGKDSFKIIDTYNSSYAAEINISGLTICHGSGNTGGGLMNNGFCKMTVSNCFICDNDSPFSGAGVGGGLANGPGAEMEIANCEVLRNKAYTFGGGVYNMGKLTITNTTFAGNISYKGGGIFNIRTSGIANISNCTFSGNLSTGGTGCAIYVDLLSNVHLNNCTISNNIANGVGKGGGIFVTGATVYLRSTLIAGNGATVAGPDIYGTVISEGHNLIGDRSGSAGIIHGVNFDLAGDSLLPLNAKLAALAYNGGPTQTHALLTGSPAIDSGDCNGLLTDQRGISRPTDGTCDIGAFEFAPSIPVSFGTATIFIGAKEPKDNGKKIDIKAELFIDDSLIASPILLNMQIAGHQNNNGLKFVLPLSVNNFPVNPGNKIRLRILARKAGNSAMNTNIWFNIDSLVGNSRGYSRMTISIDNKPMQLLYLSDALQLSQPAGDSAESISLLTEPAFKAFGTWTIPVNNIQQTASRMAYPLMEETTEQNNITVYPNPATNQISFTLSNPSGNETMLQIFDISGKRIQAAKINPSVQNIFKLNTSDFYGGSYFYTITESKQGKILRISKGKFQVIK